MRNKQFFAYSASAGSGKTYALALRYIALLFMGQNPSEILAATFTKKAANEMKQRVLKLLNNLDKEQGFIDSLIAEYSLKKDEILANQQKVLKLFLKSQNHIVTLDSFFSSVLRSCALEIGLEPDFVIKKSKEIEQRDSFLQTLDRENQISSLVKLSINLHRRKSQDIVELLETLFNLDALLPSASYKIESIDDIANIIEAKRKEMLELIVRSGASVSAIRIFETQELKEFIKKGVFEKDTLEEHRYFKKYLSKEPKMQELFSELKAKIAKYHEMLEKTILHYLFKIYNIYKNVKIEQVRAKSELDFNDILYFTHRLLSNEVTKEFLYFKLDTKFKHILLDEFQDTSALQYLILEPLIDEIFAGIGQSDFRTFFYVGDVKQSLYRFRGGVEELFEYIAKKHKIGMGTLDTNYRSAKLIVEKTNDWFKSKIVGFVPQKAKSKTLGYVEVCSTHEPKEIGLIKVQELLKKDIALEDIAILVFANKDGIAMQEYLKMHNIDSILKTSSSLRFNQKIAALVEVLEYLLTGQDILVAPFKQKIGKVELDFSWFKDYYAPFDVLEKIVQDYSYFGNDLNILKLIDYAKEFSTIEEFLDEFSTSNIELAKGSKGGLEIMTIHGSKGLEFKYTIVLDRFGGKSPNRDMLLFENNSAIELKQIHYKSSKKEIFVKDYANALESEKKMQEKDRLNLLYVALTRAELGLIVVQKEKSSEFKVLGLESGKFGEIVAKKKLKKEELQSLDIAIKSYGKQDVKQLIEESEELLNYEAINFGEALHYALEVIDFNNKASLKDAIDAVKNRFGAILEEWQISSIEKRVSNLLECQEFKTIIKSAKLLKEQPIVYKEKFYQLDLLAKFEDKNIVLDYKSSKKFEKKHIEQVKNYTEALKAIDGKEAKGHVLYVLEEGAELVKVC